MHDGKVSVSDVAEAYMALYGQAADKSAKALQYAEAEVFARKFGYILLHLNKEQERKG